MYYKQHCVEENENVSLQCALVKGNQSVILIIEIADNGWRKTWAACTSILLSQLHSLLGVFLFLGG